MTEYSIKTDETLVELTLLGSDMAYEELVRRHESAVKGSAYKVTGNEFSAEDASQDAFVSAWMHLSSLKEPSHFRSWVCSIAKNSAKRLYLHYRSVMPDISLSLLEETDLEGVDMIALENERQSYSDLHVAVESLSTKIRETVKLHYFEGLSVAEIAERLSVPEGTVKSRLHEGRKQLRKGYGVMEKEYNENETMVQRVMRQVERLKLWRMKNDKTGFEEEYKEVLQSAEALEDSKEKSHALADILILGYWWLPENNNNEMLAKIKKHAEESRNEDVMMSVLAYEHNKIDWQEKLKLIKEEHIPYIEKLGMNKSLGYLYFWLGNYLFDENQNDEGFEYFKKVLSVLNTTDVYYSNAIAAIRAEEKRIAAGHSRKEENLHYKAVGEEYRYIDGKLCFWQQPGYGRGGLDYPEAIFYYASRCDNIIYDPEMKVGDIKVASDKKKILVCKSTNETIETPAGVFENCSVFLTYDNSVKEENIYCETAFCPGIGIVYQKLHKFGKGEFRLKSYVIKGGDGVIPFASGNRWEYDSVAPEGLLLKSLECVYEVTGTENGRAVIAAHNYAECTGYDESTWIGNMLEARHQYCPEAENGDEHLSDVTDCFDRALKLAKTKREKIHTAIARDVMKRILMTDPEFNPDYTEKGKWNFFEIYSLDYGEGKTYLRTSDRSLSFEWKDIGNRGKNEDGWKIFYNFLYDILQDAAGCVWSDKWIPGYTEVKNFEYSYVGNAHIDFKVLDNESVETPVGTFENCRHIAYVLDGLAPGWGYRGGHMEYWLAPGVGIVKFRRPVNDENDNIWILTKYEGTGEGYFPAGDGFVRRYEPTSAGNGWHGSVEYTFDEDESGIVIFRNALGTQDRANYEADNQ